MRMKAAVSDLGALIIFTDNLEAVVEFYSAIGVPLELEQHGDGPVHYACDLGLTHFAVFHGGPGAAPEFRLGGSSFAGFTVNSLEAALGAAKAVKAEVVQEPTEYPWGWRALVKDPDGRVVELFERPPRA
jgi:predicted enzyme related to lactoylglutathione lyase